MKNNGLSETHIKNTDKLLKLLNNHVELNNPDAVKNYIANLQVSTGYKRNLTIAYDKYAAYCKIQWQKPIYYEQAKQIKIPTKEKLEMFIASAGKTLGTKLQLSMETGLRPVELHNLKVKDIDTEQRIIYPTTAKHGSARALKISNSLTKSLQEYIIRHNLDLNNKVFKGNSEQYSKYFRMIRNRLAKKLNDPTLKTIRLYDFRHYYATTLYAKTRDILLVMKQMGHKKIATTLIYTQLLNLNDDEWICKTAQTVEESKSLIENGFEYVTEQDGIKLFKKRK